MVERAVEVLAQYRAHMGLLLDDPSASDSYLDASNALDQLRALSSIDASLSVPMVQVLIAHTEVVAFLAFPPRIIKPRGSLRAWTRQAEACEFLQERCDRLVLQLRSA